MTDEQKLEIAALVNDQFDGSINEETRGRLQELLRGDPDAQEWYVEYCQLHSMLAWDHGGLPQVQFTGIENGHTQRSLATSTTRKDRRWRSLAIATSLLFIISAGLLSYNLITDSTMPWVKPTFIPGLVLTREDSGRRSAEVGRSSLEWHGMRNGTWRGDPRFNT